MKWSVLFLHLDICQYCLYGHFSWTSHMDLKTMYILALVQNLVISVQGRIMAFKRCPYPNPYNLSLCYFTIEKGI